MRVWAVHVWANGVWADAVNTMFDDVLAQLEGHSVSTMIWVGGIWVPGLFEHSIFDEVLENLEK